MEVQENKKSRSLVFTSSTKREIGHFHVVIVQWRPKKKTKKKQAQKRDVRTKLLFYSFFAVPVTVAVVFAKASYYFLVHSGNSGKE